MSEGKKHALLTWPVVEESRKAQQSILAPDIAVQFDF